MLACMHDIVQLGTVRYIIADIPSSCMQAYSQSVMCVQLSELLTQD